VAFKYQTADLPSGSILDSATASAKRLSDDEDFSTGGTAVIDDVTASIDQAGTRVTVGVQNGTDEDEYLVTVTSTLDTGEIFVDQFTLVIDDGPEC
jgi:hypothetical protein